MIFKFSERLLDDLKNSLGALRFEMCTRELIKTIENSVRSCVLSMTRLRKFFKEHKPSDKAELIRFFKEVKPQFKSQLIFYQHILEIEKNKPDTDVAGLTDYYLGQRKCLVHFFEGHRDFY